MAKLLCWVLILGCFSDACKRSIYTFEKQNLDVNVPKRQTIDVAGLAETAALERDLEILEPEANVPLAPARMLTRGLLRRNLVENRQAPHFITSDVLGLIVCAIIKEFPLRPASDPIGPLASVSRQWDAFFRTDLFWNTITTTPNAALYALLTKKTFSFNSNRAIFMTAKALLLEEERLELIVEANDPVVLIGLGELSYEEPTGLVLLSLYQQLRHTMPKELVPGGNWTKTSTFSEKLKVLLTHSYKRLPEEYTLMRMAPVDLIRLFYLQDIKAPICQNWLYSFFSEQVYQLYHRYPEVRRELAARLQELSRVTLPRSRTSLVFECMYYPAFVAMLARDFDFFRMLSLDYAMLEELYAEEELLLENIKEFRNMAEGNQAKLSVEMFNSHQSFLRALTENGTCGFSVASIKEAFRDTVEQTGLDRDLFQWIQDYIRSG